MAVKMNSNTNTKTPKLSLGPILYYWDRDTIFDFYNRIENSKVDIVYLGETVCSKRKLLRRDDWLNIAERLQNSGKEVILSSMALIEANSDLATLKTLCSNKKFSVEAMICQRFNSYMAIHLLQDLRLIFIIRAVYRC